jgi:outer membrane protein TolC
MKRTSELRLPLTVCALLAGLVSAGSSPLKAQQQTQAAATPTAPQEAPPVIPFPATGITLEEAVRLTLQHDPNLKRSYTDLMFSQGVAQQLRGAFDAVLAGTAEYTHRTQELSETAKEEQRKRREKLQKIVDDDQIFLNEVTTLRSIVEGLRNAQPGQLPLDELSRINPSIAATLRVLDQLIITSPADQRAQLLEIRSNFLRDTAAQLTTDIDQAVATANANRTKLENLGPPPVDEVFIEASANIRLDKKFRSGISVSPFMDATFNGTNFKDKPRADEFGGKNVLDQLQFKAGVNFTLPLMRGRGVLGTASQERAALLELDAARLSVDHNAASSVLNTVVAYWNLRAAQDSAAISAQSVKFQSELLTLTRQLITAEEMPAIEQARAQASEARAQAQLQDAERRAHEARVALADAMGIAVTADPATLPRAADDFPEIPADPAVLVALIEQAVGKRLDLGAAAKVAEAGQALVAGARRNLGPRLDVSLGTWYTALGEGTGRAALDRWVGPSGTIAFDFEKPLGNNTQEGLLVQAEADAAQRRIGQFDLDRRIRLAVVEAAGALQQAATAVQQAQAAVGFYQSTIESELRRLRTGDATLIDTVITQQQQIDALLSLVQARQELAQRLARIRFETGGILTGGKFIPRDGTAAQRDRK